MEQPYLSAPNTNTQLTSQVALRELAALRAQWPQHRPVDVVQLIAEGRDRNDERLAS